MLHIGPYIFKRAETNQEFEQIHRLNFLTFVNEIPQHADPGNGHLVDKFHDKNVYFIVIQDHRLVGMISAHNERPFSITDRLPDPEILERPGTRALEVRLLAIEPEKRHSTVFMGLIWMLYDFAQAEGYTHLYISGVKERVHLYRRLGLEPLGPAVPSGAACFVPMVLSVGRLPHRVERVKRLWEEHMEQESIQEWGLEGDGNSRDSQSAMMPRVSREICLLPGPVTTSASVSDAFQQPPIYHRGPEFIGLFRQVQAMLGNMVGRRDVALFNGSGTLANEAIAAALAAGPTQGRGVILVNGEFGRRLARQATRFGLKFRVLEWAWGQPWDLEAVGRALAQEPGCAWVWGVHLESSTGVLNDLPGLVAISQAAGARVCADCISSLGAVPLDLQGVYLASGATGKSLGSYAGLAIVFAKEEELGRLDLTRVPSYLDVVAALANDGPRYTFPSSTVRALEAALAEYATVTKAQARYEQYATIGKFVRHQLRLLELEPLAAETDACPVVTTFAPPGDQKSQDFVSFCQSAGFAIGGQSRYLAERRLVQIATMGAISLEDCTALFNHLKRRLSPSKTTRHPMAS